MSEGRLYHPCENQHSVFLEILKFLCSTSVGIILSWHTGCSGQWDTLAAGGEQAALSKGITNHPALGMEWGGCAAPEELAVGSTTGNGAAPFPPSAAKQLDLCYPGFSRHVKLGTLSNTLLFCTVR